MNSDEQNIEDAMNEIGQTIVHAVRPTDCEVGSHLVVCIDRSITPENFAQIIAGIVEELQQQGHPVSSLYNALVAAANKGPQNAA